MATDQTGPLDSNGIPVDQPGDFNNPSPIAVDESIDPVSNLPGAERPDGLINWLGSSYSGADIKVVAHLYGSVDTDRELENINNQLNEAIAVRDAISTFLSNANGSGLNLEELRQIYSLKGSNEFIKAGGLQPGAIGSSGFGAYFSPFVSNPARTIVAMTDDNDVWNQVIDSLTDQLKTKKQILDKSSSTIVLATLQTLSVQTHREKFPVRGLGQSYVKGYTRGPRTIAGSMIFTLFNEHALAQLIRAMSSKGSVYGEDSDLSTLIADQLPPIDLTIVFANEYGSLSQMGIYGVEFVNDSMTMSIEDMITEEVVNFVARDIDIMTSKGNIRLSKLQRGMHINADGSQDMTGTNLIFSSRDSYNAYLDRLSVRRWLSNR